MKNILVLGSGLVSRPGIKYLLGHPEFKVTVASLMIDAAKELVKGHENGQGVFLDIDDQENLSKLISDNEIVISLLPWMLHGKIAKLCLKHKKHMVTASYSSNEITKHEDAVINAGIIFLNEMGLDPGIDHMTAMKIIDEIHDKNGKIIHFHSYCGGIPAPEAKDNPFSYKFAWSPMGVLLATLSSAQYMENGEIINIPGDELFNHYETELIPDIGKLEVYPNRNSLPYQHLYELDDALSVKRGSYRYAGWCETMKGFKDLGLLDNSPRNNFSNKSYREVFSPLIESASDIPAHILEKVKWLGLLDSDPAPPLPSIMEILSHRMNKKMAYEDHERDMVILQHKFIIENEDKSCEKLVSTLIDYGIPDGDSSMSRTVSLPLAISVKRILDGTITKPGIRIPVTKDIYLPVIEELITLGIQLTETRTPLSTL